MKVLVIPGWYPGKYTPQSGNFYVEQIKLLKQAGVDIAVITLDLDARYYLHLKGFRRKKTYTIESDVPIYRISGGGMPKRNKYLLDLWAQQMLQLYQDYVAQNGKPDVIHAHNFWGGYVAMQLSAKENIPYVFSEVFSGVLSGKWPNWQKEIYKDICNQSKEIIAVSKGLAEVIENKYFKRKCNVIPNFIDTERFYLKEKRNLNKVRFLGVADLIPLKHFDMQILAFSKLIEKGVDAELIIIGVGPEEVKLKKLLLQRKLTDHVKIILGVTNEQIAQEMRLADIFLLTSDTETFGIVVVEALSVGTPVIATMTAGPKDILNKQTGILVPINDEEALAEAMSDMIENYDDYKAQEIRNYAVNNYGKDRVISNIVSLYKKIVAQES